jgi:hypothetical protein
MLVDHPTIDAANVFGTVVRDRDSDSAEEDVMSWSLNIGSVAGTAVRVHVTFLLFLAWIFGVNYFSGGAQRVKGFWLSASGRVQVMCPACLRGAHGRWPDVIRRSGAWNWAAVSR